jgi:hypothetical protein
MTQQQLKTTDLIGSVSVGWSIMIAHAGNEAKGLAGVHFVVGNVMELARYV